MHIEFFISPLSLFMLVSGLRVHMCVCVCLSCFYNSISEQMWCVCVHVFIQISRAVCVFVPSVNILSMS